MVTKWIKDYLLSSKKAVIEAIITKNEYGIHYTDPAKIPNDIECIIVLGGDGTLLSASHDLKDLNIPLFGVNLGTLGFLAETEQQNIKQALDALIMDRYTIESRMMISMKAHTDRKEESSYQCALNDIVITRSGFSRLINTHVYVNGAFVNEYRGDGVIISTPTGSTGYSLSAGGPIVTPETDLMIITPICPHSLNARSMIVSSDDIITLKILTSKKTQAEEAIVTVDGNDSIHLKAEDYIEVEKALSRIKLIKLNNNFFDILRKKLSI